jgi:PIN domain nuclease of toxin-antitoxin system
MRVLLDTHAILWWLIDDKMSSGKLSVKDLSFPEIPALLRKYEFQFLPIRLNDLEQLQSLPWHHRDPFDRLLIAQSIAEGIPLMTSDSWVEDYQIKTVW